MNAEAVAALVGSSMRDDVTPEPSRTPASPRAARTAGQLQAAARVKAIRRAQEEAQATSHRPAPKLRVGLARIRAPGSARQPPSWLQGSKQEPQWNEAAIRISARKPDIMETSPGDRATALRLRRLTARVDLLLPPQGHPSHTQVGPPSPRAPGLSSSCPLSPGSPLRAWGNSAQFPSGLILQSPTAQNTVERLEQQYEPLVAGIEARLLHLEGQVASIERSLDRPTFLRERQLEEVDRLMEVEQRSRGHTTPPGVMLPSEHDEAAPPPALSPRSGWRSNQELELRRAALITQQAELVQANTAYEVRVHKLEQSLLGVEQERDALQREREELWVANDALKREVSALRDERRRAHGPLPLGADAAAATGHAITRALEKVEGTSEIDEETENWEGGWSGEKWIESMNLSKIIAEAMLRRLRMQAEIAGRQSVGASPGAQGSLEKEFVSQLGGSRGQATIEALLKEDGALISSIAKAIAQESSQLAEDEAQGCSSDGPVPPASGESSEPVEVEWHRYVDDNARMLSYGSAHSFYSGLSGRIGAPRSDRISEIRMHFEHCLVMPQCVEEFTAGNYGISTNTQIEWEFVVNPFGGLEKLGLAEWPKPQGRLAKRVPKALCDFAADMNRVNEKLVAARGKELTMDELVAMRLYTGPCFQQYNRVLRVPVSDETNGELKRQTNLFEGTFSVMAEKAAATRGVQKLQMFSATLHSICLGIERLSKLTKVRTVYRAPGGAMPKAFIEYDPQIGTSGGIEMGFMSCTTAFEQARQYALTAPGARIVYEVHQGLVNRGAEIHWLSQFPCEAECLFPPFSALEVIYRAQHDAHGQEIAPQPATRTHGGLLIVELRVSVPSHLGMQRGTECAKEKLAFQLIRALNTCRRTKRSFNSWIGKVHTGHTTRIMLRSVAKLWDRWASHCSNTRRHARQLSGAIHRLDRAIVVGAFKMWIARHSINGNLHLGVSNSELQDYRILIRRMESPQALQRHLRRPMLRARLITWMRARGAHNVARAESYQCRLRVQAQAMRWWRHKVVAAAARHVAMQSLELSRAAQVKDLQVVMQVLLAEVQQCDSETVGAAQVGMQVLLAEVQRCESEMVAAVLERPDEDEMPQTPLPPPSPTRSLGPKRGSRAFSSSGSGSFLAF